MIAFKVDQLSRDNSFHPKDSCSLVCAATEPLSSWRRFFIGMICHERLSHFSFAKNAVVGYHVRSCQSVLDLNNSMPRTQNPKIGVTTLEDISALILQSHDLDETLRNIVSLVARRMHTDFCSIYLLD